MEQKNRTEDVDGVLGVEGFGGDVWQVLVCGDASVVDEDVDAEGVGFGVREVVACCCDDVRWACGAAHVRLHCDGFDAVVFFQGGGDGARFRGG